MAQAMLRKTISTQTGKENVFEYKLTDNKSLKMYYSNVYKERVIGLSLSSSKNFIYTLKTWKKFRKLVPKIEEYFEEENDQSI